MRISDWSSDVCSSDLFVHPAVARISRLSRNSPCRRLLEIPFRAAWRYFGETRPQPDDLAGLGVEIRMPAGRNDLAVGDAAGGGDGQAIGCGAFTLIAHGAGRVVSIRHPSPW